MKERQPDAHRPQASLSGQRESLDRSLNYTFHFPRKEEGLDAREAAGGVSGGLPQATNEGAARVSPPGAYRRPEPRRSSHLMDGGTHLRWGLGDADSRRMSYPLRDTATAGTAYDPTLRPSFTPRTVTTAPIYSDGERLRESFAVCHDGGFGRTPDMQTFKAAPRYGHRNAAQRSESREPSLLSDDTPSGFLYTAADIHAGCKKTFLTEAAACNSRLSDSPETRRSSQTESGMFEPGEIGPWDYNIWRAGRSPSCCSTNTIYANTSDPGAPQATYENVFECLVREGSTPTPSPGWHEEPIYATLGEQHLEEEDVTDFMHEELSSRDYTDASHVASGRTCLTEDEAADSSGTSSGDEFSPSASTLTLRPGGEGQASGSGCHKAEEQDTAKHLHGKPTKHAHGPDSPPPALPPKLLKKKPTGLKLHIPEAVPTTEDYGLQVRLPLERDENTSSSPGLPPAPSDLEGEAVKHSHRAGCRQGSLYVVVGSSSPGEPRY